jgi:hypothetical protein
VHKKIIKSTVKKVAFVSDGMSYLTPRGRWCHISVLNVRAPTNKQTPWPLVLERTIPTERSCPNRG